MEELMQFTRSVVTAVALCVFGLLAWARADEQKVPLDQVPQAVKDAANKEFPGAKITGAEKESENGKTMYELQIAHGGQKLEAEFTPEGQLKEIEQRIKLDQLPEVVRKAVKMANAGATLKGAEKVIHVTNGKRHLHAYEVAITTQDGKKKEVVVSPKGKLMKGED
jgi:uncharacterized membrane protein YkoI